MATTVATAVPSATRRLLRDLADITASPIDKHVSACPLDEDIYEWHVNLRNSDVAELILHLVMKFPKSYPRDPPSVTLCTAVPHANVVRSLSGYRICLDMLETGKVKAYEGWSSSYGVASLLMQLQAFIFDQSLQYNSDHGDMAEAVQQAKLFECARCPHKHKKPWPVFPTKDDLRKMPQVVIRRAPVLRKAPADQHKTTTPIAVPETLTDKSDAEAEWTVVESRRKRNSKGGPSGTVKQTTHKPSKQPIRGDHKTQGNKFSWASIASSPNKKASADKSPVNVVQFAQKTLRIVKNAELLHREAPTSVTALRKLVIAPPRSALPSSATASVICTTAVAPSINLANAGALATLPYEILFQIISSLSAKDVLALSVTCQYIHTVCEDGHLWRDLFARHHPGQRKRIMAATMLDWKAAFAMEANCVSDEMRCFASKATWEEDVLGLPVMFTMNPKTQLVDYIACEVELLSRSAFYEDKVRTTVWNEKFTDWLPVYITEEHFQRALPDIGRFMVKMCPERRTSKFEPDMVLEVIPKMMNTLIVLLCDHGIAVSSRAIEGYFLLHRLLTALIRRFPRLQSLIDTRVANFVNNESTRQKKNTPSLGNLLPLVPFSSKHQWISKGVSQAFLSETMDRSVLWVCAKFPALAKIPPRGTKVEANMDVLEKVWEAGKVSRRLLMFHVYVMWLVRREPSGNSALDLVRASDVLYGRPPKKVVGQFEIQIKKILEIDSWPDFFQSIFVPTPSKTKLTALWYEAVRNSIRKKYHTPGMDFRRVHRSGVSTILLKGQSYTAPPNLKTVVMKEDWRFEQGVLYLDATCSVFDFAGNHLEHIYYCRTSNQNGSIRHSGDIIDHNLRHGTHTITVDIQKLPKNVKALAFCMSAYTTPLTQIRQPQVRFSTPTDDGGEAELCRYEFLPPSSPELGQKTNIVMCALWRKSVRERWEVKAVGTLGQGRVTDFGSMMGDLRTVVGGLQ